MNKLLILFAISILLSCDSGKNKSAIGGDESKMTNLDAQNREWKYLQDWYDSIDDRVKQYIDYKFKDKPVALAMCKFPFHYSNSNFFCGFVLVKNNNLEENAYEVNVFRLKMLCQHLPYPLDSQYAYDCYSRKVGTIFQCNKGNASRIVPEEFDSTVLELTRRQIPFEDTNGLNHQPMYVLLFKHGKDSAMAVTKSSDFIYEMIDKCGFKFNDAFNERGTITMGFDEDGQAQIRFDKDFNVVYK